MQSQVTTDAIGGIDGKWSQRRTLLFVVAVCLAFWVAVALVIIKLI